jgi:hypothetical protein
MRAQRELRIRACDSDGSDDRLRSEATVTVTVAGHKRRSLAERWVDVDM